jgi:RimJ/RimL family protein N-acetyltransferase
MMAGCHPENAQSRRVIHKLGMHAAETRADFPGAPPGVAPLVFSVGAEEWLREDGGGGRAG